MTIWDVLPENSRHLCEKQLSKNVALLSCARCFTMKKKCKRLNDIAGCVRCNEKGELCVPRERAINRRRSIKPCSTRPRLHKPVLDISLGHYWEGVFNSLMSVKPNWLPAARKNAQIRT